MGSGGASNTGIRIFAVVAILFGLLTLKTGATVLFGPEAARQAAGNIVNFVLWFNTLAGGFYVIAGFGLWFEKRWVLFLSAMLALSTAFVFLALGVHISDGGLYQNRTLAAMTIRLTLWSVIFFFARRHLAARVI